MVMTKAEQTRLGVAEMRVREAEERIRVLFGDAPTNTFTSVTALEYKPLLPDARIKFVLPGLGNVIWVHIHDEWLEVMGNNRIVIHPQASNVVQIQCTP